jgi:hypothetical protein
MEERSFPGEQEREVLKMELPIRTIPAKFSKSIPKGLRMIKKGADDFLLVESLFCPHGHNLIVDSVRIHDEASIKLKVRIGNDVGLLFIDPFWGSHAKLFSFIPRVEDDKSLYVEAFCPYCDASLIEHYDCTFSGCDSHQGIIMRLPGAKNQIHVCARLGCPGHKLEIKDLPRSLVNTVSKINFFGAGTHDYFEDPFI